jgi:hypothetical protein
VLGVEGSFLNNRSAEPVLVVRVLLPPGNNPTTNIWCRYRVTVADKTGIIAVSRGCGGSRTIEEYTFARLPITSAKGLVVEFYPFQLGGSFPTNSTLRPIARLKL